MSSAKLILWPTQSSNLLWAVVVPTVRRATHFCPHIIRERIHETVNTSTNLASPTFKIQMWQKKCDMGSFFTCAGGVSSPAHLPVVPEQRAELRAGAAKHAGPREARAFPSFLGGANFQISQIFKFSNQQKVKHFLTRKLILENGAKECIV